MDLIKELFNVNTKYRYMEVGFSEGEAQAMSWIAQQKARGKFWGATTGLFLAVSWGHWHDRILAYFRINYSKRFTQLGIIMGTILLVDYFTTGRRKGANEYFANNLFLNTSLLYGNIDSLIENFNVYDLKFTQDQINAFNYRRKLLKTNHSSISKKNWVHNPELHSDEQFFQKYMDAQVAPWIKTKKPSNFSKILDVAGDHLGIPMTWHFGWSQIH